MHRNHTQQDTAKQRNTQRQKATVTWLPRHNVKHNQPSSPAKDHARRTAQASTLPRAHPMQKGRPELSPQAHVEQDQRHPTPQSHSMHAPRPPKNPSDKNPPSDIHRQGPHRDGHMVRGQRAKDNPGEHPGREGPHSQKTTTTGYATSRGSPYKSSLPTPLTTHDTAGQQKKTCTGATTRGPRPWCSLTALQTDHKSPPPQPQHDGVVVPETPSPTPNPNPRTHPHPARPRSTGEARCPP